LAGGKKKRKELVATTTTEATTSSSISTSTLRPEAASTTVSASSTSSHPGELLKFAGNLLVGLLQNPDEIAAEATVVGGEERIRGSGAAGTPGAPDAVDIILNIVGHVIVDHIANVLDVCREEKESAETTQQAAQ